MAENKNEIQTEENIASIIDNSGTDKFSSFIKSTEEKVTEVAYSAYNFLINAYNNDTIRTIGSLALGILINKMLPGYFLANTVTNLTFGSGIIGMAADLSSGTGNIISNLGTSIASTYNSYSSNGYGTISSAFLTAPSAVGDTILAAGDTAINMVNNTQAFFNKESTQNNLRKTANVMTSISNFGSETAEKANNIVSGVSGTLKSIKSVLQKVGFSNSDLGNFITGLIDAAANVTAGYTDGVTETTFGSSMEESWNTFLSYIANSSSSVTLANYTPYKSNGIYTNTILGVPFKFTQRTDPDNRNLINTFVKDGKILTLTPGLPKFNGGTYSTQQTGQRTNLDGAQMLNYLLKNGIDKDFAEKDKRYYTFNTKYEEYYAYLESMLNTVWLKMGLGENTQGKHDIFSFFKLSGNDANKNKLKNEFENKSFGFFVNINGSISESVDSSPTSIGSESAQTVNSASEQYQRINYLTGMGTGNSKMNLRRNLGVAAVAIGQAKDSLIGSGGIFENTVNGLKSGQGIVKKLIKGAAGLIVDTTNFATKDTNSMLQAISVANGMKVVYPELWSDTTYSKNMNFDITFTSPYGDPLSIFKYVYAPFYALLCFALPRQADVNGYVSPFFVRADIPGLFTSDLALISDITWTKGGDNNLWTKDGLPRSIKCSITIQDLYPYLAMTKRYSYLSANPSFAVFLGNMAGIRTIKDNSGNPLSEYWEEILSRVNSTTDSQASFWNKFSGTKRQAIQDAHDITVKETDNNTNIPWLIRT